VGINLYGYRIGYGYVFITRGGKVRLLKTWKIDCKFFFICLLALWIGIGIVNQIRCERKKTQWKRSGEEAIKDFKELKR